MGRHRILADDRRERSAHIPAVCLGPSAHAGLIRRADRDMLTVKIAGNFRRCPVNALGDRRASGDGVFRRIGDRRCVPDGLGIPVAGCRNADIASGFDWSGHGSLNGVIGPVHADHRGSLWQHGAEKLILHIRVHGFDRFDGISAGCAAAVPGCAADFVPE